MECESPSDDAAAIARFTSLFAERVRDIATCRMVGTHLQCEFNLPGPRKRKPGQIMALGHSDTVWPLGTLRTMRGARKGGRLWGPGVLDLKAGLAFFVFAMRAIRDADVPVARRVMLQLNSDEEVGSHTSRALTEREAKKSAAVLVLRRPLDSTGN